MFSFTDGILGKTFGSLSNPHSGFGSSRDPLASADINIPEKISDQGLELLYESSRIIEKAVRLLPEDSLSEFPELEAGDEVTEVDQNIRKTLLAQAKKYRIKELLIQACICSRLYGNGYLILGIDDGQEDNMSLPLNDKKIRAINWIKCSDPTQILPHNCTNRGNFSHYQLINSEMIGGEDPLSGRNLIHSSRVISFAGKPLFGNAKGRNYGRDDSVIQALFSEFVSWSSAISSAGAMIASHSLFKYKLKGFQRLIESNESGLLRNRFEAMMLGLSSLKGYILDADGEDIEFANRNYGGVNTILAELKESLSSAAGLPYTKLWGTPTGGAFSESGASDRYEWANQIDNYRSTVIEPGLNKLTEMFLLEQGKQLDEWRWGWSSPLQLTLQEEAQLQKSFSESDSINIANGVLHPAEVRHSRFESPEYSSEIILEKKYEIELMKKPEQPPEQPVEEEKQEEQQEQENLDEFDGEVLGDWEYDSLAEITEEDKKKAIEHWESVATDGWSKILRAELDSSN